MSDMTDGKARSRVKETKEDLVSFLYYIDTKKIESYVRKRKVQMLSKFWFIKSISIYIENAIFNYSNRDFSTLTDNQIMNGIDIKKIVEYLKSKRK